MTKREIRIKRLEALAYATNTRYNFLAEDFAQEYIIAILRGQKTTIAQFFIEFIHAQIDDARSINNRKSHYIDKSVGFEVSHTPGKDKRTLFDIKGYLDDFDPIDRACFVLRHMWEFTNEEIGMLFGVSAARINQRIKKVEENLDEKIAPVIN